MRILYPLFLLLLTSEIYAQPEKVELFPIRSKSQLPSMLVKNPAELLKSKSSSLLFPPKDTTRTKVRIRCGWTKPAGSPLLVVDGTIRENDVFATIDVKSISDITVLNGIAGSAIFGPDGAAGAIVITTMSINPDLIKVLDNADRSAIPGATVTFISSDKRDTLMYVADSLGEVGLKILNKRKSYTVSVSSSGYVTYTGLLSDQVTTEIKLERDFKTGPAVVISSFHSRGCCRSCGAGPQLAGQVCGMQVALIREDKSSDSLVQPAASGLRVYPNPVQRGQTINLRFLQGYFPEGCIQVLSMDGKKLFSVPVNAGKKQGQVLIPTEQSWVAGIFILQLVYANGRVGASEKVIIQ